MSTIKNYTTKTAALRATTIDARKIDAKMMLINGKNVLDYIGENKTTVLDERGTNVTPYDLWGTRVETAEDGTVTVYHELIDASIDNKYAEVNEGWNLPYGLYELNTWMIGAEPLGTWFRDLCLTGSYSEDDYKWTLIDNKLYKNGEFVANIQTNMIEKGIGMFGGETDYYRARLFEFNSDLSSLTDGTSMFAACYITSFSSDLPSLKNGSRMFCGCSKLTSFSSNLSNLTDGTDMFASCSKLESFSSDLSNLTNGEGMFGDCSNLSSFYSDLSNLTNGNGMFYNCPNLTSFSSDLSSLTNGWLMFLNCTGLATFVSDLSSLTNGYNMFSNCRLDTESLMHIAETINDVNGLTNDDYYYNDIYKTIHIGIGNTTPTEEEKGLLTEIHNKGWQVYVNGESNSNIFNPAAVIPEEDEGETPQIIPFYAKPMESDEEHAEYVSEDGKYYNILGGQFIFVDDPETYGMFVSLEDAAANMRLTKIEKA